jgi:hypothetical protein
MSLSDEDLNQLLDAYEAAAPPILAPPIIPSFNASSVASLLGLNPFQTVEEALYAALLLPCNGKAAQIAAIKQRARRATLAELVAGAPALQPQAFLAAASAAASAGAAAEAAAPGQGAAAEAAALASAGAAAAAAVQGLAAARPAVAAHAAQLLAAAASELSMARGVVGEGGALDRAAAAVGGPVVQRNQRLHRVCFGRYWLQGRMDGVVAAAAAAGSGGGGGGGGGAPVKVVETKVRRGTLAQARAPNIYDLVQVRCYLAILRAAGEGVSEGFLVEAYSCGGSRSTLVAHCDRIWGTIHEQLCEVAARVSALQQGDLEALVTAFTVDADADE